MEATARWRASLHGVWSNDPVPVFPYPGSPLYRELRGEPDDSAWERAHAFYLAKCGHLSDIQEQQPLLFNELERRVPDDAQVC